MVVESPLVRERREKVDRLRAEGREPYPWDFPGRVESSEVVRACRGLDPGAESTSPPVRVAGRLKAVRAHGKTAFFDLEDRAGSLQLFARVDELGEEEFRRLSPTSTRATSSGRKGTPVVTRRGEPSVLVARPRSWRRRSTHPRRSSTVSRTPRSACAVGTSTCSPPPRDGQRFTARSLLVRALRRYLDDLGFLEVETAILGSTASGAAAEPFVTRSSYLGRDLRCGSPSSSPSSACWSAASSASTRSVGSSATRTSTRRTPPSSR